MKKASIMIVILAMLGLTACNSNTNYVQSDGVFPEENTTSVSSEINISEEINQVSAETDNRFLAYDFSAVSEPKVFNENPIITKPLPAGYEYSEYDEPVTVEDLLYKVTQIAIVHIPDKTPVSEEFSITGDPALDAAIAQKTNTDTAESTLTEAYVQYSLFGDLSIGDTVFIFQPPGDWGVSLVPGQDYMVTLMEYKDNYKLTRSMNSVFEIDENFTITSQSTMLAAAKFNGLSLADVADTFVTEIEVMYQDKIGHIVEIN